MIKLCSTLFPGHSIPSPISDLIKPHPTLLNLINALDIPTIISGFTYSCHRIYLLSSPDLPTIVSRFFLENFETNKATMILINILMVDFPQK